MAGKIHPPFDGSLFSLDVEGEGFVPELEEDSSDCAINIKETHAKAEPAAEKLETIEVPCATYVGPPGIIRNTLSKQEAELYRNTVLDVRRYLYNSIVCEDFCVSCEISRNDSPAIEQISDVTDETSDASTDEVSHSPSGADGTMHPSPSATTVDEGIDGSRKAPRIHSVVPVSNPSSSRCTDEKTSIDSGKTTPTEKIDGNNHADRVLGLVTKGASNDGDADTSSRSHVDATANDKIRLTVSVKRLSNIVTDIEHVYMCSSLPFPRLFRLSRENLSSGLAAAGRRFFLASESAKRYVHSSCHKSFLAHLYRRKRSICFFCGFLNCPRTANCKQYCQSMRCHRCSFMHKWGKNRCNDKGSMVQYYLRSNDWRNKRNNPWHNVRENTRNALLCFYCGKAGEANFKCRKMACPRAAATIEYRCVELLGKSRLDHLVRDKPEMFKHLRDPNYVFK